MIAVEDQITEYHHCGIITNVQKPKAFVGFTYNAKYVQLQGDALGLYQH